LHSISVDFGGEKQTLTNFATGQDFIWWANAAVICARYRLPCGRGALEAVIDVHAFSSGRLFVEVVIENGRVNADAATVTAPRRSPTDATVAVNGMTIATVSSPTAGMAVPNARKRGKFAGGHEPFRAWYCSTWLGGDPGIEVVHDTASLQAHPWFFKPAENSSQIMQSKYAQTYDTYVPWATCRLRMPGMSSGGDDEQIAMLTEEQSDYVITGDKYARRAVLATGLACHTANFNWRHTNGRLPTRAQMAGKTAAAGSGNGKWPDIKTAPAWGSELGTVDGSHVPFVGLVPFLCRPSPCFIEVAQREFCWHATNYNSRDAATHPFDQIRSRGWRLRNYAAAIFLTPDADYDGTGRKASLRAALAATIAVNSGFLDQPWNTLKLIYGLTKTSLNARTSNFMNLFCVMAWTTVEHQGTWQGPGSMDGMCDKFVDYPVRYINQATAGEWRAILYRQYMGEVVGRTIAMGEGNLGERNRIKYGSVVPEPTGPWLMDTGDGTVTDWATMREVRGTPRWPNSYNYDAIFWAALCAAVERGSSAADAAWNRVVNGIMNLDTWKAGFRSYPASTVGRGTSECSRGTRHLCSPGLLFVVVPGDRTKRYES
jgi:hypothetical protein